MLCMQFYVYNIYILYMYIRFICMHRRFNPRGGGGGVCSHYIKGGIRHGHNPKKGVLDTCMSPKGGS